MKNLTIEIMKFFNTKNTEIIYNSISLESVHISRMEKVCILMECLEDADESLISGISDDIVFTDSFGIERYPDIRILPKEKDVTSTAFDY